jgi:hypothetical protein
MSSGGIYLIKGENDLVEMIEQGFDNEDLFLLAKYPRVLGGDQFDRDRPRRWLLITREAPIPAEEEGADRWAVDHLFVDEDAVPTFVEVKRSTDTRIRREVVGQMLDYVAHALVSWRGERLRAYFEAQCGDREPVDVFADVMGDDSDAEAFWDEVKTNLQAGKVRLVFVADAIPAELRRVIEFLNRQMNPAEVLGIEIRQYVGGGLQTLVPRVIGQTAETEAAKGRERGPRWTVERFFSAFEQRASKDDLELAGDLLTFAKEVSQHNVQWGTGKERGSFTAQIYVGMQRFSLFSVYTSAKFTLNLGWGYSHRTDQGRDLAEKYRQEAERRLGLQFGERIWTHGWPMAALSLLVPDRGAVFKQVILDFVRDAANIADATHT